MLKGRRQDGLLKHKSSISTIPRLPYLAPTQACFSLTYYRPALAAIALHSLFLYSDMSPPHSPSFQLAQAISEPNLYLNKHPSNLIPVILPAYTTYEDGTYRVF
jgi:hypothetical protein